MDAQQRARMLPLITFALPTCAQTCSSPLHLVGLDFYNRPEASAGERLKFIRENYLRTTAARIGRIGPTFGLGSNINNGLRKYLGELELGPKS